MAAKAWISTALAGVLVDQVAAWEAHPYPSPTEEDPERVVYAFTVILKSGATVMIEASAGLTPEQLTAALTGDQQSKPDESGTWTPAGAPQVLGANGHTMAERAKHQQEERRQREGLRTRGGL